MKKCLCKTKLFTRIDNMKYYQFQESNNKNFLIFDENDNLLGSFDKYKFNVYFYNEPQIRKLKLNKLKTQKK